MKMGYFLEQKIQLRNFLCMRLFKKTETRFTTLIYISKIIN